jgi:hypothetical protein
VGRRGSSEGSRGRNVPDRKASSYYPSIRTGIGKEGEGTH